MRGVTLNPLLLGIFQKVRSEGSCYVAPIVGALFFGGLSVGHAQMTLLIDDFSASGSAPVVLDALPGETLMGLYASSGTIGGFRDVVFTNNYQGSSSSKWVFFDTPIVSSLGGNLVAGALSTPVTVTNADDVDWTFTYDANGTGLNADLSLYSEIVLSWEADHVGLNNDTSMSITLTDGTGGFHTSPITWRSPEDEAHDLILNTSWSLNDFVAAGVDISDIESIQWSGNSDASADDVYGSLMLVPEPSTFLLAGMGTVLLLLLRRRPV